MTICHGLIAFFLIFKPLEFDRFKIGIAQLLQEPKKLDGATVAHPVGDDCKRLLRVAISGTISQGNVIRNTLG